MNQATILFEQGARLSEQGDIAKIKDRSIDFRKYYEQAYFLEKEAALLMSPEDTEPMPRTWVMNSAASLAYKAGKYEEAKKAIALCRSFGPDDLITSKLNELEALIHKALMSDLPSNGSLRITGLLSSANDDEKEIGIKDPESQQVYSMIVPAAMFKEVVKSYWLEMVTAVAKVSRQGVFTLQKISKVV